MSDETFVMQVGERLRENREALGLTQADIADQAGVTRVQWGRYERGIGVPGGEVLARAAAVGIDIRYVITGSRHYTPPTPLSHDELTLLEYWRQATSDTRKAAMGALVGARPGAAPRVQIGKVGQHVQGDLHLRSQTFNMGGKKK